MAVDRLVDSNKLDASLTYTADRIRAKTGESADILFDLSNEKGFGDAVDAIPTGGGGEWTTDGISDGSEPNGALTITADEARVGAFFDCAGITEINAPNLKTAHSLSFYGCSGVKKCSFPELTTVYFRALNNFGSSDLVSLFLPKVTSFISSGEFSGAPGGSTVAFALSTASYFILPIYAGTTPTYMLASCTNLICADFGLASRIDTYCFNNDAVMDKLVLRRSSNITTLANINAFNKTPFASGKAGGTLYVPQALISSYQSATNWSTILGYTNNQILPIEGSIYENAYADGTPIE